MSPHPPVSSRLVSDLRRAACRVRRGHVVALSAVAAVAFGLAGLRAVELPGPAPIDPDDRLRIEVVHPVEPEIAAGPIMDVGEVVDGFQGLPPPLPPLTEVRWFEDEGWDTGDDAYAPPPSRNRRTYETRPYYAPAEPERPSPARAVQRWFGFDAPRRDYQAERAARRARMEAMDRRFEAEREARRRQWAERREEWIDRRDHDDRRPAERDTDERAMAEAARDEVLFERDAFAGPY